MPSVNDFVTTGKVTAIDGEVVVFNPRGYTYQMHLKSGAVAPAAGTVVDVLIRASARKVWTVPSGGAFISPIEGPPKILQGRVRFQSDRQLVLACGANVIVDLPAAETAIDLASGEIVIGRLVNVTAMPGATIEFVTSAVPSGVVASATMS